MAKLSLQQIQALIHKPYKLYKKFYDVFTFACKKTDYKIRNNPEIKKLSKLNDLLYELDTHYTKLYSKKNPEPLERGSCTCRLGCRQSPICQRKACQLPSL